MKNVKGMQVPSNVTELRDDMLVMYTEVELGKMTLDMAEVRANIGGKIFKSAALQVAYAAACKKKPNIPFLEGEEEEKGPKR